MDNTQQNVQQVEQTVIAEPTGVNYASFGRRFVAILIDAVLVAIVSGLISFPFKDSATMLSTIKLASMLLAWVYYVYFTVNHGATLGKKAMDIRVQNIDTGANLTYAEAVLREIVGKLISSIPLLLGYFWMLWDPKKQTWHDKLGKSVVIMVK